MRILMIGLILMFSGYLSAQATWSVELHAGTNLALSHKPILNRIDYDGRTYQPGWRAGLTGVLGGELSRSSFVFGIDVINDRLTFNDYTLRRFVTIISAGDTLTFNNERRGKFRIDETQLRVLFGHRIHVKPVTLEYGLAFSGRIGGRQRFDFVQTTEYFSDPLTAFPIVLEEPLISNGTSEVPKKELNRHTYTALVAAVGYRITERLAVRLEGELGFVPRRNILKNRYRKRRLRAGLMMTYALYASQ